VSGVQFFIGDPTPPPPTSKIYSQSVSGHISSTITQDTFTVYADRGGCLNVVITTLTGPTGSGTVADYAYEWCAGNASSSGLIINVYSPIRLAIGDFDDDQYDEVVILYLDVNFELQVSSSCILLRLLTLRQQKKHNT